ncbi:SPOR domain-containing protein [Sphingomonas aracearum]|uniref:SPOR domain-containing protein n=1 Tax=Sphingomonas aracearum TaxID=2283317 RepID=A0A369VYE3_9SPHN|nr:SPOR domain-containing protein [Sphingomonas aracearum]RDE06849.1 hypothetical protein DVW87_04000 [Sphingomonas aracearum]
MRAGTIIAAAALLASAGPALADTKAGVEAWQRGDYRTAVNEWRAAARANDADAQFNLGQAYKLGRGVPVDLPVAESWYQKAAAQGHPDAETNYGLILFQNGKRDQARPWLEKAVARGEPRAQLVLGTMLYNGDGVPRDWPRAYALMVRASGSGMEQATQVRAQMDQYIPEDQRRAGLDLARQYEAQAQRPALPPVAMAQNVPPPPSRPIRGQPVPPSAAVDEGVTAAPRPIPAPARDGRGAVSRPAPGVYGSGQVPPPAEPSRPVVTTRPAPRAPAPAPAPVPVRGKGWRVQFGAFRDEANAKALWEQLKAGVPALAGAQPFLVHAGSLTRLQAGPFASSAAVAKVCAGVKAGVPGTPCVPVAP